MNFQFFLFSTIAVLGVLAESDGMARQRIRMLESQVEVHQRPDRNSPQVGTLTRNTKIRASSGQVKDAEGIYWYKVRLGSGIFGYVESNSVAASDIEGDLHSTGISQVHASEGDDNAAWAFVFRGMGMAGEEFKRKSLSYGGEGEFTFCLPFHTRGYLRRMISIGGVALALKEGLFYGGSFVFRIYRRSRIEPEIRVRFGQSSQSGAWMGGNIGINYPFSLNYNSHLAGYLEVGSAIPFSSSLLLVWGAAGLGFHF